MSATSNPSGRSIRAASRPKVVIGHPYLGSGGSEAVVMWLIEALKHDCEVSLLTTGGWNLSALNAYYGTHINRDEVHVRIAPMPAAFRRFRAAALRGACYQQFARQVASEYDIRISAYNPTDWGQHAIHFIADFSWHPLLRTQLNPNAPGFIYRGTIARKAYLKIVQTFERPSHRDFVRDDTILANSFWSAALMKEYFGVDCAAVVYPPVWEDFAPIQWRDRETSFVMIGRIASEKRIEDAIEILEAVRERGHSVTLHLCGKFDGDAYGNNIARMCERRKDWIFREGQVSGSAKKQILSRCRFGIQARSGEPFGISVAEMVKAGAIVFAPNNGGQAEILNSSALLFSDVPDAVEKIREVLEDNAMQARLRSHLSLQAQLFSAMAFMQASREAIAKFTPFGAEFGNATQETGAEIPRPGDWPETVNPDEFPISQP